ncbi:MAG TPA: GLUG motif-containing protein [Dehalococcoidia bacterium]|nr:GLUG motif-containing protein [Dehalococcoidia bacterium]
MLEKLNCYAKRLGILLITVALIAGMAGCLSPPPTEIRTWNDLDAVRDNLGSSYILMNNLDSTTAGYTELASPTANEGQGWQPIGTEEDLFTGTFNGQGYEVRDLFINRPDENFVGLFGVVGEGGIVQNIGVVNADVTGYGIVGGLVGNNEGTISNSYSTGSVTGTGWVGGLVGVNLATVSNSYSTGSVTGYTDRTGGLVGWNEEEDASVSNSYSTGSVTGDYSVGGLVGATSGTVSNSYSTGSVTGEVNVGGIVGENTATVRNSYSTGSVTGDSSVGGLVGDNPGTVSDSFWDTQTSGQATSDGGTGKTTAEMKSIATFSGAAWNIIPVANPGARNPSYIWNIVVDDETTYPFLSWQP